MNFAFQRPELLALALPLAWFAWTTRRDQHVVTLALRLLAAAALIVALAGPYLERAADGRFAVFVVDRSASMPAGSDDGASELIGLGLGARESGDEVRVVSFGQEARIESSLGTDSRGFESFLGDVGQDGSDLAAGVEAALSLIPKDRMGSLVVWTDGQIPATTSLDAAVLSAAGRGIRIDVREARRPAVADTAIERVEVAPEVFAGEPFLITAWVNSSTRSTRTVRLMLGSQILEARSVELPPGRSLVRFRTLRSTPGIGDYRVELVPLPGPDGTPQRDRFPENDSALAATRILGAKAVLVVNHDGASDLITESLIAAGIPAIATTPEAMPSRIAALDGIRAVILENVSAARVGLQKMETLRAWTLQSGGGLLMTGGLAAFGSGGYFRSPLDDLLPVSMEQRQEHRKLSVALSITLDRSGSMGAPVAGGTKMDLANRGTVEALRLLSPTDTASVIAVDSSPHVILPQTPLTDLNSVETKVLGIRSQGGGIFTATALRASARELNDASAGTKHVILFADAADAEEQTETPEVISLLRAMGATISVIGLGRDTDSDAQFLRDCARDGGGEAYFTESPQELPRLFAMDTQAVARSTFVEEATAVEARRDLVGLGEIFSGGNGLAAFPTIEGYNLAYLREGATLAAVTTDEYRAPIFSFQARGLGRVAALTAQLGGDAGGAMARWDGLPALLVTAVRWLSGVEPPEGVFASVERQGSSAVLTVELDPDADQSAVGESLTASVASGPRVNPLVLERVSATRFEARFPLRADEVALTTVKLQTGDDDAVAVPLPPVALPYSPEYERSADPSAGQRLLRSLTDRTGGLPNVTASEIFRGERSGLAWQLFFSELMALGICLLVLEIAGRRLGLWSSVPGLAKLSRKKAAASPDSSGPSLDQTRVQDPARSSEAVPPADEPRAPAAEEVTTGLGDALASARRSSQDRLNR